MAFRVELAKLSEDDLQRIYDFINVDDSEAAAKWFAGLEKAIFSLATLPERGSLTDFDAHLRYIRYANRPHVYLIFYRIDMRTRTVGVRHIRHGARKPLKSLK